MPILDRTRNQTDRHPAIAPVDRELLASVIANCWSRDTSYDPEGWSPKNPAWGQCAVTALLVQDYLRGALLFGQVYGYHHYLNRLPDGTQFDLTAEQFGDHCRVTQLREADRAYVLTFPDTEGRYRTLKARVQSRFQEAR